MALGHILPCPPALRLYFHTGSAGHIHTPPPCRLPGSTRPPSVSTLPVCVNRSESTLPDPTRSTHALIHTVPVDSVMVSAPTPVSENDSHRPHWALTVLTPSSMFCASVSQHCARAHPLYGPRGSPGPVATSPVSPSPTATCSHSSQQCLRGDPGPARFRYLRCSENSTVSSSPRVLPAPSKTSSMWWERGPCTGLRRDTGGIYPRQFPRVLLLPTCSISIGFRLSACLSSPLGFSPL